MFIRFLLVINVPYAAHLPHKKRFMCSFFVRIRVHINIFFFERRFVQSQTPMSICGLMSRSLLWVDLIRDIPTVLLLLLLDRRCLLLLVSESSSSSSSSVSLYIKDIYVPLPNFIRPEHGIECNSYSHTRQFLHYSRVLHRRPFTTSTDINIKTSSSLLFDSFFNIFLRRQSKLFRNLIKLSSFQNTYIFIE